MYIYYSVYACVCISQDEFVCINFMYLNRFVIIHLARHCITNICHFPSILQSRFGSLWLLTFLQRYKCHWSPMDKIKENGTLQLMVVPKEDIVGFKGFWNSWLSVCEVTRGVHWRGLSYHCSTKGFNFYFLISNKLFLDRPCKYKYNYANCACIILFFCVYI